MAGFDNPLMPNDRLRQIYTAMVEARALDRTLRRTQGGRVIAGHEAAMVSATVDLGSADLIADAIGGAATAFLRGASLASLLGGGTSARKHKVESNCGSATSLNLDGASTDRLWLIAGAAIALKATATPADETPRAGVVIAYLLPDEASGPTWQRVLTFVAKHELPIVFLVLPGAGNVSRPAMKCGVAAIAVDGNDAVALYRVSQESIGRARMGGGAAVVECVSFDLEQPAPKRKPRTQPDAIAGLAEYMLHRKVCTPAWPERVEAAFLKRIAAAKPRSAI